MLNYRDCSIEDFEAAMKQSDADVKTISNAHLYILYTKYKADAHTCSMARTSYASGLAISSKNKAQLYKEELQNRGINVL